MPGVDLPVINRVERGAEAIFGPGWMPCANCFQNLEVGTTTIATAGTYVSSRVKFVNNTGKRITQVRVVFANYSKSGGTEANTGNSIRVKCAVQRLSTSAADEATERVHATFQGGQDTALIPDRGVVHSDPVPLVVEPGGVFYVRTGVTVDTNGHSYPRGIGSAGGSNYFGEANGEGTLAGDGILNGAGDIGADTSANIYSPVAVLGCVEDGIAGASLYALGDSITAFTQDDVYGYRKGGWPVRAFGANYPVAVGAMGSEAFSSVATATNRTARNKVARYFTHVGLFYGANDVAGGIANWRTNARATVKAFRQMGKHVLVSTVLPANTSSNGYETVASQTQDARADRLTWNTELRDGTFATNSDSDMTAIGAGTTVGRIHFVDPCAGFEVNVSGVLTANGGYVKSPGTGATVTKNIDDNGGALTRNTTTVPVFNDGMTWNQWRGYTLFTSVIGTSYSSVADNGTVAVQPLHTFELSRALGAVPANGAQIRLFQGFMHDGVHPTGFGHAGAAEGITNQPQVMAL